MYVLIRARVVVPCVFVLMFLAGIPAFAQVDFTGVWAPRVADEDNPERLAGPSLVEFLGLPINDYARQWGLAYRPGRLSLPEHQCQVHAVNVCGIALRSRIFLLHIARGPSRGRIVGSLEVVLRTWRRAQIIEPVKICLNESDGDVRVQVVGRNNVEHGDFRDSVRMIERQSMCNTTATIMTGPGETPSRKRILVCHPATAAEELPCARQILSTLARRAFRRPVQDAEITTLMNFYQQGRKNADFETGLQQALARVLVAPAFLYRVEEEPAGVADGAVYRLSNLELASRLSFFLWSSMVVNNDPGLKAYLASNVSAQAKAQRYLVMMTRSRFDVYPPVNATPTGTHSAVFVPNRPAQVKGNTKGRPAYVWLTDENGGCPLNGARMVSVESEIVPIMVGAFAIPDNQLDECLSQDITEPNGQPRRRVAQQNHNPTVFKNIIFNTWYGHGLRAIDISIPQTPREVGYAMPIPQGIARTYPVFRDGLIYWADNDTGLHVARYTGPRNNELPGPGSGVYEGNATSPHR